MKNNYEQIEFVEGIFALLMKNGITIFNEIILNETVKEQLNKNSKFNFPNKDIMLLLGVSMFSDSYIKTTGEQSELLFEKDFVELVIAELKEEEKQEIDKIIIAYKNKLMKTISIDDLVKLMLAYYKEESYSLFPAYYKIGIKEIINNDCWKEKFSSLIDFEKYQNDAGLFLTEFSFALQKYIKENEKKVNYDFVFDCIQVEFSEKEKEEIFSKYDEATLANLEYFCDLIKFLPFDLEWKKENEIIPEEPTPTLQKRLGKHCKNN